MNETPEVSAVTLSRTAQKAAIKHGFSAAEISEALHAPKKMYPSRTYPGQWRRVTRSVCLVGAMYGGTFWEITMFPNNSAAPKSTAA